ncbi:MAG: phage terminase large subunit [Bacteroidota bacterium]
MQINVKATKPQADFFNLDCKFPAFIGGFGVGKSETMCNSALLDSLEGGADSLIAMYEPTYDLVRLILAPRMQDKLSEWGVRYTYNKSENIIYTSNGQMGDFILRTLDNPSRIVGYESFRAKIDELDTLKTEHAQDAWNKIIARNRQRPATYTAMSEKPMNTVSIFSTPEGFRFAHQRWSKNKTDDYQMIQAHTQSNPFLPDDYIQSLRDTYPPQLLEAYLEGKFVNLTSGTVYSSYDRDKCNSNEEIVANEPLFIGCDFNVTKQAATVYVKRKNKETLQTEWHAVQELIDMYDTPDMIATIKAKFKRHVIYVYPDASGGARKTVNASLSDIALLEQAGFNVRVNKKNPFVRDRITATNVAFEKGLVKINAKACPNVAQCLEQQSYNANGEPDKSSGNDHQNDATTYPIAYEMPIIKPVANVNFKFAV